MLKPELAGRLAAAKPHLTVRDCKTVLDAVFDAIAAALARGDRVELRGFGSFSVRTREARIGRNPRTGERVNVAKKQVPGFKTGRQLHARLNPPLRSRG